MSTALPPTALGPRPRGVVRAMAKGSTNTLVRLAAAWSTVGADNPYSRRVAFLKRVLPAIGVTLLLLIAVWPRLAPLWDRMRFAFPAIDLREARELRMLHPRYAGNDRLGRPYLVTAAVGHQAPDRQDLMSLEGPRADIKSHGGADVVVTADTGVYQSQTQLLDLFGNVTLVHENGTRFVTGSAHLDVAHNSAEGGDPVEGHGPSGDIKSQGFRIFDKGETIVFTGASDMLLKGAKIIPPVTQPSAVPRAVAMSAARAEAEVKATPAAAAPAASRQAPAKPKPPGGAHASTTAAGSPPAKPAAGKKS
jgi:lipopolysaccharide export system protein LptC